MAPQTVCGAPPEKTGPGLCMLNMSMGAPDATWIAQGRGFPPGAPVTVTLTWDSPPQVVPGQTINRTARAYPVAGPEGTLRLDVGRLFPGALWPGKFIVQVIGPDGTTAATEFLVVPAGSP